MKKSIMIRKNTTGQSNAIRLKSLCLLLILLLPVSARNQSPSHSRVVYFSQGSRTMPAIRMCGIWWAPVNLTNNDGDPGFYPYPQTNPCPKGWRLPSEQEVRSLVKMVSKGRGEFDYTRKCFLIKGDEPKTMLSIQAIGIVSVDACLQQEGLSAGLWAWGQQQQQICPCLSFQGNTLTTNK